MLLRYPRVLWGEQVWAGARGPSRPPHACTHIRREKELMKWQCSAMSGCPNSRAINEPPWREGTAEGFWEKQADSFVLIHYIQGKWRVSSHFYFYKLGARVILWTDEAAMFSSHLETLQFRLYLLGLRIVPRVWQLFIAGLSQSLTRGDNEFGKEPCLSSFHSIYFCFRAPCG